MSLMFSGIGVSRGIAIGDTFVLRRNHPEFSNRQLTQKQIPAEVRRYRKALANARRQLEKVRSSIPKDAPGDVSAFIETHLLMLDDSLLSQGPVDTLKREKVGAETALEQQREEIQKVFHSMEDPYIATRMDDVNHVIDLIMNVLIDDRHQIESTAPSNEWKDKIVVAYELTPADTIMMQHHGVLGLVTESGGQLSHTAILARSLGIPAIAGVHNLRTYLHTGDRLIVNGESGMVVAAPEDSMVVAVQKQQKAFKEQRRELNKLINTPAVCSDGTEINLLANIEIEEDLKAIKRVNAQGVGLYRTEFLYMNRDEYPQENEHYRVYQKVVRALKGAPLTIRTADLGSDKEIKTSAPGPLAHNPAMGLRLSLIHI